MSQNEDYIDIVITPEGLIKSTTPKISAANHQSANAFFSTLARFTLGAVNIAKRTKVTDTHVHQHEQQKGEN